MATTIQGTFPILTHKKSQTDEYGFDYVSYQYTIKTSTIDNYNIKKDDVFDGIESWRGISWAKNANSSALYVVDNVETRNAAGDLTELTVSTIGTKNSAELNTPRVSLISGGPLIFGLSGTNSSGAISGYGVSGAGQSVEVKFLANGGAAGQQAVFTTYFASNMPATFRGISLPVPARAAGDFSSEYFDGTLRAGVFGVYHGFICKNILTEKRGSLLLVTLIFSEAGYASVWNAQDANELQTATSVYAFPRIG